MSTYCELYAEAYTSRWICINSFVLDINGTFTPVPILAGGSYLFNALNELEENQIEYEYYVSRQTIAQFKNGIIDTIRHFLMLEEYGALSPSEKNAYAFFKWNERYSNFSMKN